jgi:hypothetical protein
MAEQPTSNEPIRLTQEELVRLELKGKDQAISGYDTILWKIRSGYVVVLYGIFSVLAALLGGRGLDAIPASDRVRFFGVALLLTWGFSICAALIDFKFLISKHRVIADRDLLIDLALALAACQDINRAKLRELLHNSGEARKKNIGRNLHLGSAWPAVVLYAITPIAVSVLYAAFGSRLGATGEL